MGSREESAQQGKPLTTTQEGPATPTVFHEWQSMPYYGGPTATGAPPSFFPPPSPPPYIWTGQPLVPGPYGTPVPCHTMYPPGMFPHPAMTLGTSIVVPEMEGKPEGQVQSPTKKSKIGQINQDSGKPANGAKETCTYLNTSMSILKSYHISKSSDDSGTEDSLCARDKTQTQMDGSATGMRNSEKNYTRGKVIMLPPATNLNIGMDIWNGSYVGSVPMKERHSSVNIAPSVSPSMITTRMVTVQSAPMNQSVQDEHEQKRQKRKESNRESARRSRQRKQQRCEDLARKVEDLTSENNGLRNDIEQANKRCSALLSEKLSLRELLAPNNAPELVRTIEEGFGNNSSIVPVAGESGRPELLLSTIDSDKYISSVNPVNSEDVLAVNRSTEELYKSA